MENKDRYYLYKIDGVPSVSTRELEDNSGDLELVLSAGDIQDILAYFKDYYDYSDSEVNSVKEIYENNG